MRVPTLVSISPCISVPESLCVFTGASMRESVDCGAAGGFDAQPERSRPSRTTDENLKIFLIKSQKVTGLAVAQFHAHALAHEMGEGAAQQRVRAVSRDSGTDQEGNL